MKGYAGLPKSITKLFFNIRRPVVAASMLPLFLILSGPAWANELTGRWSGTLTGTQTYPAQFTFSDAGYLVVTYIDNRGQTRSVELGATGQQIQYVPRGGGVKTHVVESVTPRPDGLSLVLSTKFERARDGYLQQQLTVDSYDIVLDSEGLKTQFVTQTAPHFGLTGEVTENRAEGILQKISDLPAAVHDGRGTRQTLIAMPSFLKGARQCAERTSCSRNRTRLLPARV